MISDTSDGSREIYLTQRSATIILIFYLVFFFGGMTTVFFILFGENSSTSGIFQRSFVGSIGASAAAGGVFYIRKLYKACFNQTSHEDISSLSLKRFATFLYFCSRPLFSVSFGIFIVLGLRASLIFLTSEPEPSTDEFLYTSLFLSFFVGFFPGRFLTRLEANADTAMDKMISGQS